MPKIDITQQYHNADDTPAVDAATGAPITLKDILTQVCLNEKCPPDEKVKRYSLFRDLKKSQVGYVQWNAEEVALLKSAIKDTHGVLVVGQTREMLEQEWVPEEKLAPKELV